MYEDARYWKPESLTADAGALLKDAYLIAKKALDSSFNAGTVSVYDLIDKVTIEIGGTQVDRHTGEWMQIWNDLSTPQAKRQGLEQMTTVTGFGKTKLRVPLSFWFCRDAGQALPLIALQYHEVKLSVNFTEKATSMPSVPNCKLWVDYVYLDTDERQRFARSAHEYLIEQVQHSGAEELTAGQMKKVRLDFNHPVKELIWTTRDEDGVKVKGVQKAKLQLNGHDRFSERDGEYFGTVQPYQYHTQGTEDIYVYSFALKPEDLQPSGTCNMSRIDHATLQLEIKDFGTDAAAPKNATKADVYAVNYNVLRIKNGMGGLAYSN